MASSHKNRPREGELYVAQCANCHGDMLEGRTGPPLAGDDFIANWKTSNLGDLFDTIRLTMPKDAGGTLNPRQSTDLLAVILSSNGFPSGGLALDTERESLARISFEVPKQR